MNPTDASGILGFLTADGFAGYGDAAVGIVFLFSLTITIIGGFMACNAERLVRAVAGLALCFIGIATIYYFLNSPLLSMMQLLIYVGAVCITIAFAVMLAAPEDDRKHGPANALGGPLGLITAGLITFALIGLAVNTSFDVLPKENMGTAKQIGIELLTTYAVLFKLISVVLLIAIIGALIIARQGRSK
jgi:NADH-quinone oxidoreductase subunit J